jgi:4-amino-4-deoxy-L-arabinose transferase-like glycosyltransferase
MLTAWVCLLKLIRRHTFWILTAAAVLLLIAPIRKGDLAGYDDAVYAHIAKAIVTSGDWLNIQSNGYPALEHPAGFVWMQAALFSMFGFSDFLARLPSAALGVGTVLLVYWLARRLLQNEVQASLAMFIILATPYFIKYTSHGMTDVPFMFLFTAAICAWVKARENAKWLFVVWAITAYALLTRGVVGLAVPFTLGIAMLVEMRGQRAESRGENAWGAVALALAVVPVAIWYWHQISMYGNFFWEVQTNFLRDKINGEVGGSWRRYTGVFEYAWMLLQSYWPWLPFLMVGLWTAIRTRDKRVTILLIWCAVMYAACSAGGSRVLRYLLPAYPAFSIFAAMGLAKLVSEGRIATGIKWLAPAALVASFGVALFPPVTLHAEEIKPLATAARSITAPTERIGFYDEGQPRFDETGQLQWYGDRTLWILTEPDKLAIALAEPIARVWIVDEKTYDASFAPLRNASVVARSGHLLCVRLDMFAPR